MASHINVPHGHVLRVSVPEGGCDQLTGSLGGHGIRGTEGRAVTRTLRGRIRKEVTHVEHQPELEERSREQHHKGAD